jgi:hypothetical protein
VPSAIAIPLVKSLRNEVICREQDIRKYIPDPPEGLTGFEKAVRLALTRIRDAQVMTRWSFASVPGAPSEPLPSDPKWSGGNLYQDVRVVDINATPERVWGVVESIGGDGGYFTMDWAWRIRGIADRAVGGVGLRRGRRDPKHLMVGETLDFWRVEELIPNKLLRLRAEMRMPGNAWLEFKIEDLGHGKSRLQQRAVFVPKGLAGHAYWWSIAPFHGFVFPGMNQKMGEAAENLATSEAAETFATREAAETTAAPVLTKT